MAIAYAHNEIPTQRELLKLYDALGWSAYTRDPATLAAAVSASLAVVTASNDGQLIGLARVVGDGHTIVYLQDILVAPAWQRKGVGRALFHRVFAPFSTVRQHVLMTDDEPQQRAFYESLGLTEVRELPHPIRVFAKFG